MYLNCKYPYWRFKKYIPSPETPFLNFLAEDYIDEIDPVERLKEQTERLKIELKHKRYGTPLPPKTTTVKFKVRQFNA